MTRSARLRDSAGLVAVAAITAVTLVRATAGPGEPPAACQGHDYAGDSHLIVFSRIDEILSDLAR